MITAHGPGSPDDPLAYAARAPAGGDPEMTASDTTTPRAPRPAAVAAAGRLPRANRRILYSIGALLACAHLLLLVREARTTPFFRFDEGIQVSAGWFLHAGL